MDGPNARSRKLAIECLETRAMLAVDFSVLKDVNAKDIVSSSPGPGVTIGPTTYFAATTERYGRELWSTDGTADGTFLLKDISPGPASGDPLSIVAVGETLFFLASDGIHGRELWRSDGTAAGTKLVKDIVPGSVGTWNFGSFDRPPPLVAFEGAVFFSASGWELWKSDGTEAGTVLVKDIAPGAEWGVPDRMTVAGDLLFFSADDGSHGRELWKSDGTAAGTALVADLYAPFDSASSDPRYLVNVNGTLFFTTLNGSGLWRSDGTTLGTALVEIEPGGDLSSFQSLTNVAGTLYFSADEFHGGTSLWKTNGLPGGAVRLMTSETGGGSDTPRHLTAVGNTLYFAVANQLQDVELWKSNGTIAGTVRVKDIRSGTQGSYPNNFVNVAGTLYFWADDGQFGRELWTSDGTSAGTRLVRDIFAGPGGVAFSGSIVVADSTLLFAAVDGQTGLELWKTTATPIGAEQVKNISFKSRDSYPWSAKVVGDLLYFFAEDVAGNDQIWRSDGSEAGTSLVATMEVMGEMASRGNEVFFAARSTAAGMELWRSNGTPEGTVLVKDIIPGAGSSFPTSLTFVGDTLYFVATFGTNRNELWKSDGTSAGTVLVKDIPAWRLYSLVDAERTLYFSSTNISGGAELWRSDGTPSGTVPLKSFTVAPYGDGLGRIVPVGGDLYFSANEGVHGNELWKSDGTAAGTVLVGDVATGTASSFPESLTDVDGTLFFVARDIGGAESLWKTDSAGEIVRLKQFQAQVGQLRNHRGTLFFVASNENFGSELWASDGTEAGTEMVMDLRPGPEGSSLDSLFSAGGSLYFTAQDGVHGIGVWQSDGTAAGTELLSDLNGDEWLGSAGVIAKLDDRLIVQSSTLEYGLELYVATLTPRTPADFDSNSYVDGHDLLLWQRRLGSTASPAGSGADGDASGGVDAGDLAVWRANFGASGVANSEAAAKLVVVDPNPEPLDLQRAALSSVAPPSTLGPVSMTTPLVVSRSDAWSLAALDAAFSSANVDASHGRGWEKDTSSLVRRVPCDVPGSLSASALRPNAIIINGDSGRSPVAPNARETERPFAITAAPDNLAEMSVAFRAEIGADALVP